MLLYLSQHIFPTKSELPEKCTKCKNMGVFLLFFYKVIVILYYYYYLFVFLFFWINISYYILFFLLNNCQDWSQQLQLKRVDFQSTANPLGDGPTRGSTLEHLNYAAVSYQITLLIMTTVWDGTGRHNVAVAAWVFALESCKLLPVKPPLNAAASSDWPLGGGACAAAKRCRCICKDNSNHISGFAFHSLPLPLDIYVPFCFWHWFTFMSVKWPTGARWNEIGFWCPRFWLALRDHCGSLDQRLLWSLYISLSLLLSLLLFMMIECRFGPEFTRLYSLRFNAFAYLSFTLLAFLDSNFNSAKCDYKMHKQSRNQFQSE